MRAEPEDTLAAGTDLPADNVVLGYAMTSTGMQMAATRQANPIRMIRSLSTTYPYRTWLERSDGDFTDRKPIRVAYDPKT